MVGPAGPSYEGRMEPRESDSSDRSGAERRTGPSVSKDKWVVHARQKLARGYILIVGEGRRSANFFKPGSGYEMCAYNVALQLIRDGIAVPFRKHPMGMAYTLAPDAAPLPSKRSTASTGKRVPTPPSEEPLDLEAFDTPHEEIDGVDAEIDEEDEETDAFEDDL